MKKLLIGFIASMGAIFAVAAITDKDDETNASNPNGGSNPSIENVTYSESKDRYSENEFDLSNYFPESLVNSSELSYTSEDIVPGFQDDVLALLDQITEFNDIIVYVDAIISNAFEENLGYVGSLDVNYEDSVGTYDLQGTLSTTETNSGYKFTYNYSYDDTTAATVIEVITTDTITISVDETLTVSSEAKTRNINISDEEFTVFIERTASETEMSLTNIDETTKLIEMTTTTSEGYVTYIVESDETATYIVEHTTIFSDPLNGNLRNETTNIAILNEIGEVVFMYEQYDLNSGSNVSHYVKFDVVGISGYDAIIDDGESSYYFEKDSNYLILPEDSYIAHVFEGENRSYSLNYLASQFTANTYYEMLDLNSQLPDLTFIYSQSELNYIINTALARVK